MGEEGGGAVRALTAHRLQVTHCSVSVVQRPSARTTVGCTVPCRGKERKSSSRVVSFFGFSVFSASGAERNGGR